MTSRITAVVNYKGGVGKTETTYRLGIQYAAMGLLPILVDMDPSGNLTGRCGGIVKDRNCTGAVLGGSVDPQLGFCAATQSIDLAGQPAYLLAADMNLENVAYGLLQRNFGRLSALADAIRADASTIGGRPVLIDTPPNAGILTLNAMVAADYLIICADPEPDAIAGVRKIQEIVGQIRSERGKAPHILGTLATRYDQILTRHDHGIKQLQAPGMPPFLGTIPKRAGQDASYWLDACYKVVAEDVWAEVCHA